MAEQEPKRLFCTSQVLSLLHPPAGKTSEDDVKEFLSGDRFWDERHTGRGGGEAEGENPWRPIPRLSRGEQPGLLSRLSLQGDIKRLAKVCSGGFGKSANLEYLAGMMTTIGLVPFHFLLDEKEEKLPDSTATFWAKTLPEVFSRGENRELVTDQRKAQRILEKARESGRLALLFDSIDQSTPNGLAVVSGVLGDPAWAACPVVITGRPQAVWDHWQLLIKPDVRAWHFLRVEPLADEQRHLLLGPDGVDEAERRRVGAKRYARLPAGGRRLMENPRHIEYVRRCASRPKREGADAAVEPDSPADYTLEDLRTAAHLFAGAVDHDVRLGFKADGTGDLGRRRNRRVVTTEVEFALDLLAAFAFAMYCQPDPAWDGRGTSRPNVSRVPRKQMGGLIADVVGLLKAAGVVKPEYDETELEQTDLPALNALNAGAKFDLLDRELRRQGDFRWHDRTLQEFLAAWWLARYAGEEDIVLLRGWRYDNRMQEARSLYSPLWGFLVEMPWAVRTAKWSDAVGVLFEPIKNGKVVRCCEMIYRAWPTLEKSDRGWGMIAEWHAEFKRMTGRVAESLRPDKKYTHFKRCPKDPKDDGQAFQMGSPTEEKDRGDAEFQHSVTLTPFRMSRGPITNEQFELFDPGHQDEREWRTEPDIARHPVVNVDWWEAWCFARWVGGRLPTEAEWEYAARGETTTPFYWGDTLNGAEANCNGNYPYGTDQKGESKGRTTVVGAYEGKTPKPHPWGLVDVHGNVWEWCADWYDAKYDLPHGKWTRS